jgi:hypothetical protein
MNTDQADLFLYTAGASITASCIIRGPTALRYSVSSVTVTMDRASLASRIAQVKDALPAAATNIWAGLPDPLGAPTLPAIADRFNECMERTIGEGSSLYADLCGSGLKPMLDRLDQMPEGSRLTVHTDCAFLPWEILYPAGFSANWPPEVKAANPADPNRMWGYRFIINYNLLGAEADWSALMTAHRNGPPFISLNLNSTIKKAFASRAFQPIQHHKDFCSQCLSLKNVGAVYDSAAAVLGQLYSNNQQTTLLYLYCHGRNTVPCEPSV